MHRKRYFLAACFLMSISIQAQTTADFENLGVMSGQYLDGSSGSGGWNSGNAFLRNQNFGTYWAGWVVSATTDTTTAGFTNQYSSASGNGANGSTTYALTYAFSPEIIALTGAAVGQPVSEVYVNNSTYAYLSMRDGDSFTKKFGGVTGDDPDYFLLTIEKWYGGSLGTEKVEFYLADYRFTDNSQDYIVKDWTAIDLTFLGNVDSLQFSLTSTDVGAFGMNTPAYFCVDNLKTSDGVVGIDEVQVIEANIFPNPAQNQVTIDHQEDVLNYDIIRLNGQLVKHGQVNQTNAKIELNNLEQGYYHIILWNEKRQTNLSFVKR